MHCTGFKATAAGLESLAIALIVSILCAALLARFIHSPFSMDLTFACFGTLALFLRALRDGRSMLRIQDVLLYWTGFAALPTLIALLAVAIGFYAFLNPTGLSIFGIWTLAVVTGAACTFTWTLTPPPNVCLNCAYDLRGARTDHCPECGAETPATT